MLQWLTYQNGGNWKYIFLFFVNILKIKIRRMFWKCVFKNIIFFLFCEKYFYIIFFSKAKNDSTKHTFDQNTIEKFELCFHFDQIFELIFPVPSCTWKAWMTNTRTESRGNGNAKTRFNAKLFLDLIQIVFWKNRNFFSLQNPSPPVLVLQKALIRIKPILMQKIIING